MSLLLFAQMYTGLLVSLLLLPQLIRHQLLPILVIPYQFFQLVNALVLVPKSKEHRTNGDQLADVALESFRTLATTALRLLGVGLFVLLLELAQELLLLLPVGLEVPHFLFVSQAEFIGRFQVLFQYSLVALEKIAYAGPPHTTTAWFLATVVRSFGTAVFATVV